MLPKMYDQVIAELEKITEQRPDKTEGIILRRYRTGPEKRTDVINEFEDHVFVPQGTSAKAVMAQVYKNVQKPVHGDGFVSYLSLQTGMYMYIPEAAFHELSLSHAPEVRATNPPSYELYRLGLVNADGVTLEGRDAMRLWADITRP